MTIGNAKAVDLFGEKDGKVHQIQVKAIRSKKSVGWPMMTDTVKDNVIYILVNLNWDSAPDYYILTPDEVRQRIRQYKTRGILHPSS